MADPIAALRAARDVLLMHGTADVVPVARAIDEWLAAGGDFAVALGMASNWHSTLRMRERDRALRELAARHFSDLTGRALARALAAAGRQYEARCWSRDGAALRRPDGRDGLLHDIAAHGGMPSEGHLRRMFAGSFAASQCASRALTNA
jgi:hypothetical protein